MMKTIKYGYFLLASLFIVSEVLSSKNSKLGQYKEVLGNLTEFLIKEVNRTNIKENLRYLTSRPHVGGTPAEWANADWVAEKWRSQGLDEVHLTPYDVLLSYSDKQNPNYANIVDESGLVIWKSQGRSPFLKAIEEQSNDVFPNFNAYSASGNITGEIVYANFGRKKDFDELANMGVDIKQKILIVKNGKSFKGTKINLAEKRGAIGVLLYSDPQQYAPKGTDKVYPDTVFMPGGAAVAGTVFMRDGDPLTPDYPSIESAFRIPEGEAIIPKIPVMPLGYDDAEQILRRMTGKQAPPEWQGGLNMTYKVGPGLMQPGMKVNVEVNTRTQRTPTYNVIGVIKGKIEPDRYVLLGNHRDAWMFGSIDPSSGTAVMLELSRALLEFRNRTGWQPRRSIVFCSWGSEEFGLVGSTEWTEQFGKQLADRAVAYLNVDMAIEGNYTMRSKTAPLLYGISRDVTKLVRIFTVAKKELINVVPNPDEEERNAGRKTIYDTWAMRQPDPKNPGLPVMKSMGSGSDYTSFQHTLGIPCIEHRFTYPKEVSSLPLFHTLYETFFLTELYDKNFDFHAAITQVWGLSTVLMADSPVIPFSLDEYVTFIRDGQQDLIKTYGDILDTRNISMNHFLNATKHFNASVHNMKSTIQNLDYNNHLKLRQINDQLMLVERAFINPKKLPDHYLYNHIVVAPSYSDSSNATAFSSLTDALDQIRELPEDQSNHQWRIFEEQLAVATHLLETAAKVLSDDLW